MYGIRCVQAYALNGQTVSAVTTNGAKIVAQDMSVTQADGYTTIHLTRLTDTYTGWNPANSGAEVIN